MASPFASSAYCPPLTLQASLLFCPFAVDSLQQSSSGNAPSLSEAAAQGLIAACDGLPLPNPFHFIPLHGLVGACLLFLPWTLVIRGGALLLLPWAWAAPGASLGRPLYIFSPRMARPAVPHWR